MTHGGRSRSWEGRRKRGGQGGKTREKDTRVRKEGAGGGGERGEMSRNNEEREWKVWRRRECGSENI